MLPDAPRQKGAAPKSYPLAHAAGAVTGRTKKLQNLVCFLLTLLLTSWPEQARLLCCPFQLLSLLG